MYCTIFALLKLGNILSSDSVSKINYQKCTIIAIGSSLNLKTLDTIGNCQRPVLLTWCIATYATKHPCHTKLCAFRCLISRPQILNLKSQNQIHGKLLRSRKLRHFRGSRFSQCFIPSSSSPLLVTKRGFMMIIILSNYQ